MPQNNRTFFITSVCHDRTPVFRNGEFAVLLVTTLMHYRAEKKFLLHAFVVMPDHMHLVLTPAEGVTLERAMQFIKGGYSHRLGGKSEIWQRGFTERRLKDALDFKHHHEYTHENPVRARLVKKASDYLYSSAHPSRVVDPAPEHLRG